MANELETLNDNDYLEILNVVKKEIKEAQYKAIVKVNRELLILYYNIGKLINDNKKWGNKFINTLSKDIKISFPDVAGFSVRNLNYMAKFASFYDEFEIVQEVLAQITWYHNIALMDKIKDKNIAIWYANETIKNGWSRNVLVHQIESDLYTRQVLNHKITNYQQVLASPQSELALQTIKDPYIFDFVPFKSDLLESELEESLIKNITKLLMELGKGFAFLGNQYHLVVGGDDYYIDLLFYNIELRCYVVIELKSGSFKPEYVGKLNFYLSAVDGILKKNGDNPSIGLLLCKEKNNVVVEYALKDMTKPIGVSSYNITGLLPKELSDTLPSVETIQSRIKMIEE